MKRHLITLIKLTIALLVIWFLTHTSKLNFSLLGNLIYSPKLLLLTLALYFVIVGISAWRWYQLNTAQNLRFSFYRTLIPTYLGIAFNNLLPGGIGGDFFRCYFLFKRTDNKRSAIMLSILFDRITGLMGIFIAVGMVTLFHFNLWKSQHYTFYFIIFCLALCLSSIAFYFISTLLPQKLGLSTWLQHRFNNKKWLKSVLELLNAFRIYRNSKVIIAKCLIASFVIQLLIALTCVLFAKMMHFPAISFTDYIIAIAVTQLVSLIPITPGGFGIGEAIFANVLSLLNPGVNATYATIFLAYRLLGIVAYLPGIAVFMFDTELLHKKVNVQEAPASSS